MGQEAREIRGDRKPRLFNAREVWTHRDLAYLLALRDIKLRYSQTVLGVAWAVLQPLLAMLLTTVLFGRLLGNKAAGIEYPAFVITGFAAWLYFANASTAAGNSFVAHEAMVTKIYYPRILNPIAATAAGLVDLAVSLLVAVALLATRGVSPDWQITALPAALTWLVLITFGIGTWLSALNVLYRDVRHAIPYMMQLWLFASPVIIPKEVIRTPWLFLYALNPLVAPIDLLRWSLAGGVAPNIADLISAATGLVITAFGVGYLNAVARTFADVI